MTSTLTLERFKIASKKEKKESPSTADKAKDLAKTVGAGAAGYVAQRYANRPALAAFFASLPLDKKLFSKRLLRYQMGGKVDHYRSGDPAAGIGLDPKATTLDPKNFTRTIQLPRGVGEAVAAHEMGHNRNSQMMHPLAYIGGIRASQVLSGLSIPAASIYAAASSDPSWTPALASLTISSPVLLDEALASARAVTHMVGRHGLGKGLLRSAPLLPAFGTYLAHALAPLAITGVKKFMKRRRDEKEAKGEKTAKLTTKLKPHQQRVVERMEDEDQPGLVAVHGLGSGKTLTSIAVADALGLPADVVTPAALQANYRKELEHHTDTPPEHQMHSLEGVARSGGAGLKNPLLIADEAHRIRNEGAARTGLNDSPAKKRLALTASLLYNHPSDLSGPINFVAGKHVFPEDPDAFSARFLKDVPRPRGFGDFIFNRPATYSTQLNPKSRGYLQAALDKYVDYHPSSSENFPTREDQTIKVPMTRDQMGVYKQVLENMPPGLRRKMLMNLPPSRAEAKQLNAFMAGARQVSNTTSGFDTRAATAQQPKIDRAVAELQAVLNKNPRAKAIVYSNYLQSGIEPYQKKLEELGIPYGAFTGEMSPKKRNQMVQDYNSDKLKALLLSSAGGEGLDLKGTRLIQLLEPHWNVEKMKQVAGRGIRYKSHAHLPEDERKVLVQKFLATRAPTGLAERIGWSKPGYGADEYLDEMGARKERLNEQVRQMLRTPEST